MKYVKTAQAIELGPGNKKKVSLEGKEILLTNINDSYYAVDNTCTHMGGSLYDGNLDGSNIVCPRHGSTFDVKTGKVITRGKLFFVKVKVHDLQSYPVKIEGADIMIGIE